MKIFDITANEKEKQEHEVHLDNNGCCICPACRNAILTFKEYQYNSTDSRFTTPRAICPNCGRIFFQIKQR